MSGAGRHATRHNQLPGRPALPGPGHAFPADFGERLTRLLGAVAGG